jgi:hypothetical protein
VAEMSVGQLISFVLYSTFRILWRNSRLCTNSKAIGATRACFLLEETQENQLRKNPFLEIRENVTFKNELFSYPSEEIKRGRTLFHEI